MTDEEKHERAIPLIRAMAEGLIRSAARENCFAVAIIFDLTGKQLIMARTHQASDFYEGMHQIIDLYRDSERSGTVSHEQLAPYEN